MLLLASGVSRQARCAAENNPVLLRETEGDLGTVHGAKDWRQWTRTLTYRAAAGYPIHGLSPTPPIRG
jgi:hypothetical protein